MSIDQYAGRTVDISFFEDKIGAVENTQTLLADSSSGTIITGVRKLTQRYLLELLTIRGSMPYRPRRGTSFLVPFHQGTIRTTAAIRQSFTAANAEAREALTAEELETDPDDERFSSATLVSASYNPPSASIRIQLTSRAGDTVDIIQPLSISLT